MTIKVEMVTVDCRDAYALADWWSRQTGGKVVGERGDGFIMVEPGADTSRCRRFLPGVGSVTCWKPSVGPPSAPGSTMMNPSPRSPTTLPPVCRDHQSARA